MREGKGGRGGNWRDDGKILEGEVMKLFKIRVGKDR